MKKIDFYKEKKERSKFKDKFIDDSIFEDKNQIVYINQLFLDNDFQNKKLLIREIENKLNSYKHQDIDKKILNENKFINLSEVIEKLVSSKLKCFYCKNKLCIFYQNIRDEKQWTLDRIDNKLGHHNDNTLIACLKCNLQRRRQNMEAFKFTKQLKIKKIE